MNMFYNYDNPLSPLDQKCCCRINDCKEELSSYSGTEIILNKKSEVIGLSFNWPSPLRFVFNIDGNIIDDFGDNVDIDYFINSHEIVFDLLDFKLQPVVHSRFMGSSDDGIMIIEVKQDKCHKLKSGTYSIRLGVLTDDGYYTLFSPLDAIINIL